MLVPFSVYHSQHAKPLGASHTPSSPPRPSIVMGRTETDSFLGRAGEEIQRPALSGEAQHNSGCSNTWCWLLPSPCCLLQPSHYNVQPWSTTARNKKAAWGCRRVGDACITQPPHHPTALKRTWALTPHKTHYYTNVQKLCTFLLHFTR